MTIEVRTWHAVVPLDDIGHHTETCGFDLDMTDDDSCTMQMKRTAESASGAERAAAPAWLPRITNRAEGTPMVHDNGLGAGRL
jgi:hypothetical protein